jgi:glutamate formiminotransferase / formiminotetrahydrofolate cyclodeaminase
MSDNEHLYTFIDQVAEGTPAPGGGSAAAYAGALGAALASMTARLTLGKKKYAEVEGKMESILQQSERLRAKLTRAVEEDAQAFDAILQAFKLPKDTPEQESERMEAIEKATMHAAEVPLENARRAVRVMELCQHATTIGNLNAISDAASGAALARAALTAAGYNVRINITSLQNKNSGDGLIAEIENLEAQAAKIEQSIRQTLKERGGLSL